MIRILALCKIYLQRTAGYANLISVAMVLDIYLKNKGISHTLYWPTLIGCGLLAILWGYIEDYMGLFEAETEQQWARSPQLRRMIRALDDASDRGEGEV